MVYLYLFILFFFIACPLQSKGMEEDTPLHRNVHFFSEEIINPSDIANFIFGQQTDHEKFVPYLTQYLHNFQQVHPHNFAKICNITRLYKLHILQESNQKGSQFYQNFELLPEDEELVIHFNSGFLLNLEAKSMNDKDFMRKQKRIACLSFISISVACIVAIAAGLLPSIIGCFSQ